MLHLVLQRTKKCCDTRWIACPIRPAADVACSFSRSRRTPISHNCMKIWITGNGFLTMEDMPCIDKNIILWITKIYTAIVMCWQLLIDVYLKLVVTDYDDIHGIENQHTFISWISKMRHSFLFVADVSWWLLFKRRQPISVVPVYLPVCILTLYIALSSFMLGNSGQLTYWRFLFG